MRLATIHAPEPNSEEDLRDGRLVVVSSDGLTGWLVDDPACRTMRRAIDNWSLAEPILKGIALNGSGAPVDLSKVVFKAPLPRATDFIDGSGYLSHIVRVRKARGADLPKDLETNPLMYRGIPTFLDPLGDLPIVNFADGVDCEAELAVVVGDVRAGATPAEALKSVLLVTQINDVSLRYRIKSELPSQFGFLTGKPPSTAGPFAVTLDELASNWCDGRPQMQMRVERNGQEMGDLETSELHFPIGELIAHAAQTHALGAGTIIGTGTISNSNESRGVACIAEQVALDTIAGKPQTEFFKQDEEVMIETRIGQRSIFGRIKNRFVQFFVLSIAVFCSVGVVASQDQQSPAPSIKIGAILPLSGHASNFGVSARRGIELALESLSPSDRERVKVVFEDDALSNARSATAARKLITIDKVDALLTWSSGTGITVAGIAEPKQIPHISVASDPAVSKGRKYSFTYCPLAADEARAMHEYMIQSNRKRVAVVTLVHNGALALRDAFVREVAQSGQIVIVANEEVAGDVTDFRAVLQRIRQRIRSEGELDGLMTILFPGQLATCIKQARAVGITAQLLGFETFDDKDEIKAAAGLMTGAIFATGGDPQPEFLSKYEQLYPGESYYTANQTHDIIRLFVEASRSTKNGDSMVKYLKDVRDQETASGRVSIAADNQFRLPTTVKQIGQNGVLHELSYDRSREWR